jgi:hypothetical protein
VWKAQNGGFFYGWDPFGKYQRFFLHNQARWQQKHPKPSGVPLVAHTPALLGVQTTSNVIARRMRGGNHMGGRTSKKMIKNKTGVDAAT